MDALRTAALESGATGAGLESIPVPKGGATASVPLLSLLKDWLASHIKQTDKEYSAHLNAAGIN